MAEYDGPGAYENAFPPDPHEGEFPLAPCPSPYADGSCRHLTCGRCRQHTDNSSQGHYWSYCKVTKSMREHHFCCPGDCELEGMSDGGTRAP